MLQLTFNLIRFLISTTKLNIKYESEPCSCWGDCDRRLQLNCRYFSLVTQEELEGSHKLFIHSRQEVDLSSSFQSFHRKPDRVVRPAFVCSQRRLTG